MKVHEIMTGNVRTVAPDTTLVEAAGLMREMDVGALPVCEGEQLAGLVTDRDIVVRGVADGADSNHALVRDVMSGGVQSVSADDEVEAAVRIMEQRQIRRLPVLSRENRLVGMISLGDIATSSNPAFSGMALRDVSEPNEPTARRRRLARESEPGRMPRVPGERKGPANEQRNGSSRARRGTQTSQSREDTRAETKRRQPARAKAASGPSAGVRAPKRESAAQAKKKSGRKRA